MVIFTMSQFDLYIDFKVTILDKKKHISLLTLDVKGIFIVVKISAAPNLPGPFWKKASSSLQLSFFSTPFLSEIQRKIF